MTKAASSGEPKSDPDRGRTRSRFGPDFDARSLTCSSQCHQAIEEIAREIADIESQIEMRAHAGVTEDGRVWLAKAKSALRHRRVTRQALQRQLGTLVRGERIRARATAEGIREERHREFITVCRERLDENLILRLWNEVDARLRNPRP